MTLIVAYKDSVGVWVGGEAKAYGVDDSFFVAEPKVFTRGSFTYGYVGSFRFGQLLQYSFDAPKHPTGMSDMNYMVLVWASAFKDFLSKQGMLKTTEGVSEIGEEGACLVVYRNEIYMVMEDFAVLKNSDPFAAIGGGSSFAFGVLWALHTMGLPGTQVVETALEAGSRYSPQCGGQKTILKHSVKTKTKAKK